MAPTTTYTGNNPSFAVYEIDEETMLLVNITTYFFNVTKANLGNPEWELYHNILQDYGLPDASPNSFYEFSKKFLKDEETALKVKNWLSKGGPDIVTSCDENCRRSIYCDSVTSMRGDLQECEKGGIVSNEQKQGAFSFDKYGAMLGFSADNMYEVMADPWLQ